MVTVVSFKLAAGIHWFWPRVAKFVGQCKVKKMSVRYFKGFDYLFGRLFIPWLLWCYPYFFLYAKSRKLQSSICSFIIIIPNQIASATTGLKLELYFPFRWQYVIISYMYFQHGFEPAFSNRNESALDPCWRKEIWFICFCIFCLLFSRLIYISIYHFTFFK